MQKLEQALTLRAIDRFTGPAKKIANAGEDLTDKLSAGQKAITKLGRDTKAVNRLKGLEDRLSGTSTKLGEAKREVEYLRRQMELAGPGAKTFARDLDRAKRNVLRLADSERKLKTETASAHERLREAGIDTRNLAGEHERLRRTMGRTVDQMRELSTVSARIDAAQQKHDAALQRAANTTLVAGGLYGVGRGAMRMLGAPLQRMRGVEAAKGEIQSVGIQDTQAVIARGQQISRQLAGIDTASFVRAAYDIKSGISTLSDKGVADMTASAALTAKATKSQVGQMTSLFATAYGTYKDALFQDLSDAEFGGVFSASLAKSVQQFKTTGAGMQQAIQAMGSGLAASGVSLSDQLTGLGMLQQKMEAGVAGTTLKAIERTAAVAQERFQDMGIGVRTLDDQGNMMALPKLLEQMQATFGDNYTTDVGAKIQKAFGSDEAVAFFKALWGQQDIFRANAAALEQAATQGDKFTSTMAKAMDRNMDARLQVMGQRWNVIMEKLGARMVPILEKLTPIIETVVDGIGSFIDNNAGLATGIIGVTGVVGGLALVAAPVITSIAALGATITWLGLQSKKAAAANAMAGIGGGAAGGSGKGGRGFMGRLKGIGKGVGGKLGAAGALATGALSIGSTLMDDRLSGTDQAAAITKDVGGIGGGLAGAAAGAALGSVVPVVGTAIGGILGGIAGSMGGGWLGEKAGDLIKWFGDDDEPAAASPSAAVAAAANQSRQLNAAPAAPVHHEDKRQFTFQIAQQPGENAESLAQRVMEKIRNETAASNRGALYDPLS